MYDINPTAVGWQTEEEKKQFDKFGYAAKVGTGLPSFSLSSCRVAEVALHQSVMRCNHLGKILLPSDSFAYTHSSHQELG